MSVPRTAPSPRRPPRRAAGWILALALMACGRPAPVPSPTRTVQVSAPAAQAPAPAEADRTARGQPAPVAAPVDAPVVAPAAPPAAVPAPASPVAAAAPSGAAPAPAAAPDPVPPPAAPAALPSAAGPAPAGPDPALAREVLAGLRTLAASGNASALGPFLPRRDRSFALRPVQDILDALEGRVTGAEVQGGRVVLRLDAGDARDRAAIFLAGPAGLRYDASASARWAPANPGPPDFENRELTLEEALRGLPGTGEPAAAIDTTEGTLQCVLLPAIAPRSVATFAGLARGRRAFLDPGTGAWVHRPFYDDQPVHEASAGAWVSFGCTDADCRTGPGFSLPDELDLRARFDAPGCLAWDADPPNAGGGRVVITAAPAPDRDDRATIFGRCGPGDVLQRLSAAAAREQRGRPSVRIRTVTLRRGEAPSP